MRSIEININDTVAFSAELPRNLNSASVDLLLGEENPESASAVITDAEAGEVQFPVRNLDFSLGANKIYWEITYEHGGKELLPPEGDTLYAHK